jgi:ABC-type multidrug transport system ATPase subunit
MSDFVITTTGLKRAFGDLTAVAGIDLQVRRGSVYGFLGPNGAGKTTTIRMLLGLIRPHAGRVTLFGQPLQSRRIALLRRVGAMVETPSLYAHLTGRENLELTRRLTGGNRTQIDHVLHVVRLEAAADRPVKGYSSGMRQRLGLALALLGDPELLILDEPTNGLDPAGIREMRELICRLPESHGVTVFLSSHLLGEVEQVATHIGIIHQGRLLFQGTPDTLQAQLQERAHLGVDRLDETAEWLSRSGWSVQRNGHRQLIVAVNGLSDVSMLNRQLVEAGVNVFHLSLERPSLEDIFLELTQTEQEVQG